MVLAAEPGWLTWRHSALGPVHDLLTHGLSIAAVAAPMIRSRRIRIVHALLAIFALAIAIQAARVELLQGRTWQARAARQHLSSRALPAPRGDILDATGLVLAQSRDMVQLELAPREVRDRDRDALRSALLSIHMNPEWIDRAIDSPAQQEWLTLPGRGCARQ